MTINFRRHSIDVSLSNLNDIKLAYRKWMLSDENSRSDICDLIASIPYDLNSFLLESDLYLNQRSLRLRQFIASARVLVGQAVINEIKKWVSNTTKICIISDYFYSFCDEHVKPSFVPAEMRNVLLKREFCIIDLSFQSNPENIFEARHFIKHRNTLYLNPMRCVELSRCDFLDSSISTEIQVYLIYVLASEVLKLLPVSCNKILHLGHVENHGYEKGVPLALAECKKPYLYVGFFKGLSDYYCNLMNLNYFSFFNILLPDIYISSSLVVENFFPNLGLTGPRRVASRPLQWANIKEKLVENYSSMSRFKVSEANGAYRPSIYLVASQIPSCKQALFKMLLDFKYNLEFSTRIKVLLHPNDNILRTVLEPLRYNCITMRDVRGALDPRDIFWGNGTQLLVELLFEGFHTVVDYSIGGSGMISMAYDSYINFACSKSSLASYPYFIRTLINPEEFISELDQRSQSHINHIDKWHNVLFEYVQKIHRTHKSASEELASLLDIVPAQ